MTSGYLSLSADCLVDSACVGVLVAAQICLLVFGSMNSSETANFHRQQLSSIPFLAFCLEFLHVSGRVPVTGSFCDVFVHLTVEMPPKARKQRVETKKVSSCSSLSLSGKPLSQD